MTDAQKAQRTADDVCTILATIMAHGCNVGPYTMSRLTEGITYRQIKWVTDWQLLEDAQRQALDRSVNAISKLDVTQAWGEGKTSSSDGQRFRMKRKLLQQTYSPRFNDYAIEFYSFVADNYAPFYSTVIECTDRDAAFVLDGLLYNESDLALEEYYTDTHGYTEINFAAFAMLGRRFAPRIRGLKKQRIYRIDKTKEYGSLTPLVDRWDRTIHLDWIGEQWDRMGQFYASLESGHTTASTALKRLAGYTGKNQFYGWYLSNSLADIYARKWEIPSSPAIDVGGYGRSPPLLVVLSCPDYHFQTPQTITSDSVNGRLFLYAAL
jgi:hypothetical protein